MKKIFLISIWCLGWQFFVILPNHAQLASCKLRKGGHADTVVASTMHSIWVEPHCFPTDIDIQGSVAQPSKCGCHFVVDWNYVLYSCSIAIRLLTFQCKAPPTFCVRDDEKAKLLYTSLLDLDFVNDGVFYTQTKPILECIENGDAFDFGRRLSTAARQFVHRSGTLFVRLIRDRHGWVIVVVIPNGMYIKKDEDKLEGIARTVFRDLVQLVASMTQEEES